MFRFPPTENKIQLLSGSLTCLDADTRIRCPPGVTWLDGHVIETGDAPVIVIEAGENVPASAFTLNGRGGVEDILLEVVTGTEVVPYVGLQDVVVPEK